MLWSGCRTADRLGRRYAMTVECGVFMVGVLIQVLSFRSWVQFAIGRLISGLGVGSLSAAVPMYQAETAPPQIRGTLTATYQYVLCFHLPRPILILTSSHLVQIVHHLRNPRRM